MSACAGRENMATELEVRTTETLEDRAATEHAEWQRAHPSGWATTPRRSIQEMTALRHREITIGRTLTEPERDAYLRQLRKDSAD